MEYLPVDISSLQNPVVRLDKLINAKTFSIDNETLSRLSMKYVEIGAKALHQEITFVLKGLELPAEVTDAVVKDSFIAGGLFKSLYRAEELNDVDVFFKTKESADAVRTYFLGRFPGYNDGKRKSAPVGTFFFPKSDDPEITERTNSVFVKLLAFTDFAVTLEFSCSSYKFNAKNKAKKDTRIGIDRDDLFDNPHRFSGARSSFVVQFVFVVTGAPASVVETFDFLHCMAFYDPATDEITFSSQAKDCLERKIISVNPNATYPVKALRRLTTYALLDWTIPDSALIALSEAISKLDLSDPAVRDAQTKGMYP